MLRILGIHDGSGCGYYRVCLPLGELAKHGHEVTLAHKDKDPVRKYMREPEQWDVIVGERLIDYGLLGEWRGARTSSNRLVYENDDDVFNITMENWAAYNAFNKADVRNAVETYANFADLVTVTTEPLAEVFREFNPNVAILNNCVPALAFDGSPSTERRPRIGWVGGASHGRDVHLATEPVRRFIKRHPEWDFYLGATDYRPTFKVPLDRVIFEPWHHITDNDREFFESLDFDIGIAPLLDTKFAQSKSAVKAIEYGARGIPVVASDATAYRDYVVHGKNGFLAKNETEFLKYLELLASDDELRAEMSVNARDAAQGYSIENRWQQWEKAYEGMWRK